MLGLVLTARLGVGDCHSNARRWTWRKQHKIGDATGLERPELAFDARLHSRPWAFERARQEAECFVGVAVREIDHFCRGDELFNHRLFVYGSLFGQ